MITLPKVLECCTTDWQDHDAIARKVDEKFPPRWYSILRHFRLLAQPNLPSINIRFLLELAVQQGKLERRLQTTCCMIPTSKPHFLYRIKRLKTVPGSFKGPRLPVLQAA